MLVAWATAAQAAADPMQQQRQWFEEARQALNEGHMARFQRLRQQLTEYPLLPYLDIWEAWKGLADGRDYAVAETLTRNADIPESYDLNLAWIESLAERGQWPHVVIQLQRLPGAAERLPEIAMLSQWYNGAEEAALASYGERWMHGMHFSDRAHRLAAAWQQAGHPSAEEAWRRIGVLARKGKWSEIERLADALPRQQQPLLKRWHKMQQEPLKALQQWQAGTVPALPARLMLADTLRRLSLDDCEAAWHLLARLADEFEAGKLHALQRQIALRGARSHLPAASQWLAVLAADEHNDETRAWRVRLHLLQGEWQQALAVIEAMPADERGEGRWLYWRARCLAAIDHQQEAKAQLAELAKERGYYSFMAAEYLGTPYQLQDRGPEVSSARLNQLAQKPGIRRAHEWWLLQDPGKAGREWYAALADAGAETWEAAASLAHLWGWYDRAIYGAYRAGANDAMTYRFPLGYEKTVAAAAAKNKVHASLIWSVIRQESAFNMQAVSRTGARGLMQLMPTTADELSRGNKADLFDPAENIGLGSRYLARLVRRFDGNEAIAVAAYNAGPSRVSKWLEHTPFTQPDVWVEAIPYDETRRYVQQVMAFMVVYDWRQAKEPVGLAARMQSVAAADEG